MWRELSRFRAFYGLDFEAVMEMEAPLFAMDYFAMHDLERERMTLMFSAAGFAHQKSDTQRRILDSLRNPD